MYCPRCRRDVPATEHEYSDRIMYVCSKCGFVIKVVHKSRRLYFPDRTPYPSPFISLGALFILILFCIAPVFSISISQLSCGRLYKRYYNIQHNGYPVKWDWHIYFRFWRWNQAVRNYFYNRNLYLLPRLCLFRKFYP